MGMQIEEAKARLLAQHDDKKLLQQALQTERAAMQKLKQETNGALENFKVAEESILSLQRQLTDKDDELDRVRRIQQQNKEQHVREQKLIVTAWYDMGMRLQRRESAM